MASKTCFVCNMHLDISMFYKHKNMGDGHLNKCKTCTKKYEKNRRQNPKFREKILSYDRARGFRQGYEYTKEYRERFPRKYKAHTLINNAIKKGLISQEPCEVCGSTDNLHAHHDDYSKPLIVRWLCASHHKLWHVENGEGLNA